MKALDRAADLLQDAVATRAFPAACIEVGRADSPVWRRAFGTLSYDADAPEAQPDTIFDLASLTKVICTTTLVMRTVDAGRLDVDAPVARWFAHWRGEDRAAVTVRDLLAHCSGLTSYLPLFRSYSGRAEFEHAICSLPLEYAPRSQALYSDLGFILLGFLLEDLHGPDYRGDGRVPAALASQFLDLAARVTDEPLAFNPPRAWKPRTAPTERDEWRGRLLVGEVHDENAWALGGAAGHAGLFGTAGAVGAFARAMLRTIQGEPLLARAAVARAFIRRTSVPGSSRALGWDTMLPTSSCGSRLSATAIGHTGFTGTSLWIDWERDLYIVLLTNRVHPTRENDAIRTLRPRVHDAVVEALRG
ncbi:MAG TPA: serine hydrolase domain-containing protein [Vicinamibacterales bacterium]|nr:serine hydrolase domain-containing protein [Vicinamibacterales bacterium]